MKRFNTAGTCFPDQHYMVNIDRQVGYAARLVEQGEYFCINRGRQYGKTTTLAMLETNLTAEGFVVFSISFEGMSDKNFSSMESILAATTEEMGSPLDWKGIANLPERSEQLLRNALKANGETMEKKDFTYMVRNLCATSRCVLIIDEVDQAGNYPEFVKFLGLLREMYLKRTKMPTFQSIILAGVYDIKNLKLMMRPEEEHQYNSPWNIAVPFDVDMSLPADGIAAMLDEYRADHSLSFDAKAVAQLIYDYTSGYPFLVSRLCQIIDQKPYTWDKEGVLNAIRCLTTERNTLFDDMVKKVDQYPLLKVMLRDILFSGKRRAFATDEKYIQIAAMFNFIKNDNGSAAIACRLIETRLYNLFIAEEESSAIFASGQLDKNQFIHDGTLDMRHLIERFSLHFNDIYRPGHDDRFVEEQGRKIFLTYLRPVINGIGNYYCEAQTRDLTRTDVIIDYLGHQYIVELKIWRGNSYQEHGRQQLSDYLDYYHLEEGYLVSFCFNKDKEPGLRELSLGNRTIIEAIV
ncbi:MAG: AAA-like domain-containing protein [Prevotella sp.]|nr:AAA-like domain-containing protein [Prevotella sp.]